MSLFSELSGIVDPGGDPQAIYLAATACGELAAALRQVASSLDTESTSLAASWKGIPGPNGEDDSASAKYQGAWHKFSTAIVEYAGGLDDKKDGAEVKLQTVAAAIQDAQDQARHMVEVAEVSVLVGLGLSAVTFGISGAFGEAGAWAQLAVDAETLAETLGYALRAATIVIQGLGQALLNIATRFVIGAGFAVLSVAFAKAVHGENPFNLDNWDANDISSIIVLGMVSAGVGALASDTTGFKSVAAWMRANPTMGNVAYFGTNGFLGATLSEYAVDGEKFNLSSALGVVESTALSAVAGGLYGKYIVSGRIGAALGLNGAPDVGGMPNDPGVVVPDPPGSGVSVADALNGGAHGETAPVAGDTAPPANPGSAADSGAGPAAHASTDGAGAPASESAHPPEGVAPGAEPGSPAAGQAAHASADDAGAPASESGQGPEDVAPGAEPGSEARAAAGPAAHAGPDGADTPAHEGAPAQAGADGPGAHAASDGQGAQADGAGTGAGDPADDAAKSPGARVLIKAGEVTGVKKSNLLRSTFRSPASSIAHALSFEAPPPVPAVPLALPAMPRTVPSVPPPPPVPPHQPTPPPGQRTPPPGHPVPTPPGQLVPTPPGQQPPPGQPPPGHIGGGAFTVRPGDTLWEIARERLGNPLLYPLIEQANPQIGRNALIFPGEVLNIPQIPVPPEGSTVVVVQPGDTLWRISGGNEALIQEIARINHIKDPSLIFVGQALIVP